MANGRCSVHGGKSLTGDDLPQTIHGGYSRYLPDRLKGAAEAARTMPNRLSMDAAIEVLDTRIFDRLEHLDKMPPLKLWERFRSLFADLRYAHDTADEAGEAALHVEITDLISRGGAESAGWVDLRTMFQERARLVESERRLLIDAKQYVTKEQAMLMLQRVISIVEKHVTDQRTLGAIADDLTALSNARGHDSRQPARGAM